MSGDSPFNSSRSTVEKGLGAVSLGLCWFARLGRGLRLGSCTALSVRSGRAAFAKTTYWAKILVEIRAGLRGEIGRDPCPIGGWLVRRVDHSAPLQGMMDGKGSNKFTAIGVGK